MQAVFVCKDYTVSVDTNNLFLFSQKRGHNILYVKLDSHTIRFHSRESVLRTNILGDLSQIYLENFIERV